MSRSLNPWILTALLLCLILPAMQGWAEPVESAWQALIRENPDLAEDGTIGPLERALLEALTPEQHLAFVEGAEPHSIVLASGESLADFLARGAGLRPATKGAVLQGLVYYPVPNCVVASTGNSPDGKLEAGEIREFLVRGVAADLSAQGGSATGCGVPPEAEAIVANFWVYAHSGDGKLKVAASDQSLGTPLLIRYDEATADVNSYSNATVLDLCLAAGCMSDFQVRAQGSGGRTHLEISVSGYFAPLGIGGLTTDGTTTTADLTVTGLDCTGNANGGALTTDASGVVTCSDDDAGTDQDLFSTLDAPAGTDPVADSATDTLTLAQGGIVSITGDAASDTLTISATEVDGSTSNELQNLFATVTGDSGSTTADAQTDTLNVAGGSGITTSVSGDTLTIAGTDQDLFATVNAPAGSDPVADSATDTLNLAQGGIVSITGDAASDTLTISATEVDGSTSNELQNLFATVTGNSGSTTADAQTDTLSVVGGSGITTSVSGDTLTIAASGSGGLRIAAVDGLPPAGDCTPANEGELLYGRDFGALFVCVGVAWQISELSNYLTFGVSKLPWGIAFDTLDRILVADINDSSIQVFDSSGKFLFKFGSTGTGNGQFRAPVSVAADASNRIIVSDADNARIQVFDSTGAFQFKFGSSGSGNGQFRFQAGLTVDSLGRIIVCDRDNHRIQVFDSTGAFQFKFGTNGSGNGQFILPDGVATDSTDRIIVADTGNGRIQIFDSAGTFVDKFGSIGSGLGQFSVPRGLTVDSSDRIYVVDTKNHRIQIFDSSGTFVSSYGQVGSAAGQFRDPNDAAFSSLGLLAVADGDNSRIQIRLYP